MFNKELYKETFSTLKASENTLSEVLRKTKESKAYKTHQPALRRLRPGFAVAAAILITLLFTTTVLAATGVLNYRDFFNSVFNNEAAAPYIHTGDDITIHISDSDIEVKLVSAFFDAAYVDKIFFELDITDPTGKRLSDSFILFARTDFGYHPLSLDYSAHVQRINENTVRAAFSVSHFFRKTPEGVNISFDLIAAGIYYPKPRPTGLFIGKLIDLETPINVPGSEFIEILEVSRQGGGVSITYQIADYAIYGWGEGSLGLMKPNGEIIWSRFSVGSDTTKISFNIGDINPNDLALVVAGARAEQVINGQWSFNVAIDDTVILEPGKFIGEYNGLRTEVDVGATHVRITVHNAAKRAIVNDIVFDESPILLHMADGKTIVVQRGGASGDAEIIGIDYFMDFINPGDVVSIEFLGVKIGG